MKRDTVTIPDTNIGRAEEILTEHLASYGPNGNGIQLVGGSKWWRVRGKELEGEWIEVSANVTGPGSQKMQKDHLRRTANEPKKDCTGSPNSPIVDSKEHTVHISSNGTKPVPAASESSASSKAGRIPGAQTAANMAGYVPSPATAAAWARSYMPRKQATMSSVKDNTGAEVSGERVILYIHGACSTN